MNTAAKRKPTKKKHGIWPFIVIAVAVAAALTVLLVSLLSDLNREEYVEIKVKNYGSIVVKLDHDAAPRTAKNFVKLAKRGFYEGRIFHRVIEGFMIQGGSSATGKEAREIRGEFEENGYKNPLLHKRGVISMARTNDPNSASSQFFIMHETNKNLDGKYAAFGCVVAGMDVVDAIASVPTNYSDRPYTDIVIESVTVLTEYTPE
ncbi:MAG: peptidylprolyl isomerase [Clostridia bacterium]|nr:peptidylprolyl isomerase [Clostridia bacterium]